MAGLRDYLDWHRDYDNPTSPLSERLRLVQRHLRTEIAVRSDRDVRVLSVCAGDGRDVLGVLDGRADLDRFDVTLLEILPELATAARERAAAMGLDNFVVREMDAGTTDAYADLPRADIILMVGIFGNISPSEIERLIALVPAVAALDALVLWSRSATLTDLTGEIRAAFEEAGCADQTHEVLPGGASVGTSRFAGAPAPLPAGERVFTFHR